MSTSAEAGATPPTRTPQRGHSFHLSNPVHAALQLLTDVLANIPGPHRARIQPFHKHSSTQSPALISSSSGSGRGEPSTAVLSSEKNAKGSQAAATLTKEEVGTATWMLLHGVAAQYPDNPSRQQKKDVKQLVSNLRAVHRSTPSTLSFSFLFFLFLSHQNPKILVVLQLGISVSDILVDIHENLA